MSATKTTRKSTRVISILLTLVMVLGMLPVLTIGASAEQSFFTPTDSNPSPAVVLTNGNFSANIDPNDLPAGSACETADSSLLTSVGLKVTDIPDDMNQIGWVYVPESEIPGWHINPSDPADNDQPLAHYIEVQLGGGNPRIDLFGALNQELWQVVDTIPGQTVYYSFDVIAPDNGSGANFRFRLGPSNDQGNTTQVHDIINEPAVSRTYSDSYVAEGYKTYFGFASTGVTANTGMVQLNGGTWTSTTAAGQPIKVSQAGPHLDNIRFQTSSKLLAEKSLLRGGHDGYEVSEAYAGENLRYRIHISNVGQTEASSIIIKDELPDNLIYRGNPVRYGYLSDTDVQSQEANASYDYDTHTVTFSNMAAIRGTGSDGLVNEAYGDYYLEFDVQVKPNAGGSILKNQVSVDYKDDTYENVDGSSHTTYSNILETPVVDKKYSVFYYANAPVSGNAPIDNRQYSIGDTPVVLGKGTMQYEGFEFAGWSNDAGTGGALYQPGSNLPAMTADVNLYARWTDLDELSVTYLPGSAPGSTIDGFNPVDAKVYYAGDIVEVKDQNYTVSAPADGSSYIFTGWAGNGTTYSPGSTFTITADTTLTAQWHNVPANMYPVVYHANGGEGTVPDTENKIEGDTVTVSANVLTKGGSTFLGWARSASATAPDYVGGNTFKMPAEQVDLYAVWQVGTANYTLKYWLEDTTGSGTYTYQSGKDDVLSGEIGAYTAQITPKAFAGHTWHHNNPIQAKIAADGSTVINVYYSKDAVAEYPVVYHANGGEGTVPDTENKAEGDTVTVSANVLTKTGNAFLGWARSASATAPDYKANETFIMPAEQVDLYAVWQVGAANFTLKYWLEETTGTGIYTYQSGEDDVLSGEIGAYTPQITPKAFPGYTWHHTIPIQTIIAADGSTVINVYYFKDAVAEYPVVYHANGGEGTVPDTENKIEGDTVTVSANVLTKTGNAFLGWARSASATAPDYKANETFIMPGEQVDLYAVWQALHTVTYDVNGGKGTPPADAKKYADGEEVEVKDKGGITGPIDNDAEGKNGSFFVGWNTAADGSGKSYDATDKFNITEDTTLYAQWLSGAKTSEDATPSDGLLPGDVLTYFVTVNLPEDATTLVITDPIPAGTTYVPDSAASTGGVQEGNAVKWNLGQTSAGTHRFSFQVTVNASAGNIENTVTGKIDNKYDFTYTNSHTTGKGWTVTYNGNDTSAKNVPADKNVYSDGSEVTVLDEGSMKAGDKHFVGWNTKDDGTGTAYAPEDTFDITGNTTLYAQWMTTEKKVSDPESGVLTPGEELTYTITVVVPEACEKFSIEDTIPTGTTFVKSSATSDQGVNGFVSADRVVKWSFGNVDANTTINATFKVKVDEDLANTGVENTAVIKIGDNAYKTNTVVSSTDEGWKVTYDGNGNTSGEEPVDSSVYSNEADVTVRDKASLEKEGYEFAGWNTTKKGTGTHYNGGDTFKIGDDTTLYAQWIKTEKSSADLTTGDGLMPGDRLTYTIEVELPSDAEIITVTDRVPDNTTFGAASNGGKNVDGTVTWTMEAADWKSAGGKVSFYVTVNASAPQGADVENVAGIELGYNDPESSLTFTTNKTHDLVEPKSVQADDGYKPGSVLVYTIKYVNSENENADIVITDVIPDGTSFVPGSATGPLTSYISASKTLTWTISNAAPGESGEVSFKAKVNDNVSAGINNQASIQIGDNDPKLTNTVRGTNDVKLSTVKDKITGAEKDQPMQGDTITYTVNFANGDTDASITITDKIPANTTYVEGSAKLDSKWNQTDWNISVENGSITWENDYVVRKASGYVTFDVVVNKDVAAGTMIKNKAYIDIGNNGPKVTNETVDIVEPKTVSEPETDIIYNADPNALTDNVYRPGEELTYTIYYTNDTADRTVGDEDPTVVIKDSVPEGTRFVSADPDDRGAVTPDASGKLTWTFKNVMHASVNSVSFKVVVDTNEAVGIANTATVTVGDRDPKITNTTKGYVEAKNSKETTPDDGLMPGDTLSYSVDFVNFEAAKANVTIKDTLPANTSYVAGSAKLNGENVNVTVDGNSLTLTVADVKPGEGGKLTFDVTVNEGALINDPIKNSATVKIGDNEQTTNIAIDIIGGKDSDDADEIYTTGQEITYTIAYANEALEPANITITDTIPEHTEYVKKSASPAATLDKNGVLTWNIANVRPGATGSVSFTVKVMSNAPVTIENQAIIGDRDPHVTQKVIGTIQPKSSEEPIPSQQPVPVNGSGASDGLLPGDTLHYEIGYANTTAAAANITITDSIPAHTTFVAGSAKINGKAAGIGVVGGKLTFVVENVAAKASGIVSFDVTINEDAKSFDEIRNKAEIKVGDNDPITTNETIDIVEPKKTDDTGEIEAPIYQPGQELTYTIKYANDSIVPQNITITDVIPANTSYVADSVSENGTVSGSNITWKLTNVPAGTVGTVSFKVIINSDASTIIENQAMVIIGGRKPIMTKTNIETGTVEAKSSEIENPATGLMPGDEITYTVSFVNSADAAANITVKDVIPTGTTFKAGSAMINGKSVTLEPESGTLTFTIPSVAALAGGEISFRVTVNDDVKSGTAIKNKAEIKIGNNDPVTTNETVDIVEAKTSDTTDGKYKVGDEITYNVAFANDYFQKSKVTVTDIIPSGTEYVEDSGKIIINGGKAEGIDPVNGKFTYKAILNPGDVGLLTFTVRAVSGGTVNNTATVEVGGHDPKVTNTVTDRADVKVSAIKDGQDGDGLQPGDTLIYTVNYTNSKDTPQTIVITDAIPAKTTFVSGSAKLNGAVVAGMKPANGKLTWTIENVEAGASGYVSFEVTVNANAATGTAITNTASIKIGDDKPTQTNKTVDIVNAKSVDDTDGIYTPGQILTFTIKYGNSSAENATVTITDTVPNGTEFVNGSVKVNGKADAAMKPAANGMLTWVIDDVKPGATGSVSFQVEVTAATPGTQIDNQAVINNNPTNIVIGKVKTKTSNAPDSGVSVGSLITYTVTYRNSSAAEQTVKITDAIPENTTYVQNSADNGGILENDMVVWKDLTLASGESITVSFKVKVNAGTANGTAIRNKATITPPVGNVVVTNETIDIVNPKSVDYTGLLSKGQELTYTIVFANDQNTAQNIIITDAIPTGTEFVAGSAKMTVGGKAVDVSALAPVKGKLVWNADNVASGTIGNVSFTVKVTASSGSVSNTGSIRIGDNPEFKTNTVTNKFPGGVTPGDDDDPIRYTLTFVTNGGTSVPSITRDKGTVIALTQTTSKSGYTFEGWYSDAELTNKITSVTLNSNMTVYAKWSDSGLPAQFREDHVAYVIGYPDGNVLPEANITRGETATIFFRLLTDDSRDSYWMTTNSFSDVNSDIWFNNAVSTMANAKIINGYDDGTFGGYKPITRAEFAVIAARANGADGTYAGPDKFTDIADSWARAYINEAAEMGLITGYTDGTYKPNAYITRAEAMTIVNRFLARDKVDSTSLISGMITWPDNMDTDVWYYYMVQEATNSHDFVRQSNGIETWTELTEIPDWAALETSWAVLHGAF